MGQIAAKGQSPLSGRQADEVETDVEGKNVSRRSVTTDTGHRERSPVTTPRSIRLAVRLIDSSDEGSSAESTYQFKRTRSTVSRDAAKDLAVDDSRELSTAQVAESHDAQFVNYDPVPTASNQDFDKSSPSHAAVIARQCHESTARDIDNGAISTLTAAASTKLQGRDAQVNPDPVDIGRTVILRKAARFIVDHLKETWSTPIQRQSRGTMPRPATARHGP